MGLVGCGGNGQNPAFLASSFAGNYVGPYTRASGTITVTCDDKGVVTVTVTDSPQGTFVGTGQATSTGSFGVVCTGTNKRQIMVQGSFSGTGLTKNVNGKITGTFAFNYSASRSGPIPTFIWQGHYDGSYQLSTASGNYYLDVNQFGSADGHMFLPDGSDYWLTGKVYQNGVVSLTASKGLAQRSNVLKGSMRIENSIRKIDGIVNDADNRNTVGEFRGQESTGE